MFRTVAIREQFTLDALVADVLVALRTSVVETRYSDSLRRPSNGGLWATDYPEIDKLNESILESLKGRGGVYAILVADPKGAPHLKYSGQTNAAGSKQRIRSHFIWRNKITPSGRFTGSKFDEVQRSVSRKFDIYIAFVEVAPESLRHYVEETLIKKKHPPWNFNGTTLRGQRRSERHCVL